MIHIGKEIEKELNRQGISKVEFGIKICCQRANVYKILNRANIDSVMLLRISIVLNRDFFALYREELKKK